MPAMAVCLAMWLLDVLASSLASQLPQGYRMYSTSAGNRGNCGSWLASDGGVSGDVDVGCHDADVGSPHKEKRRQPLLAVGVF
ncbi:MAG TPA: hypothetical protein VJ889_08240, partial [Pseudomonas sp.]|nr:hypothetical protein [Pseudomonas sp.]